MKSIIFEQPGNPVDSSKLTDVRTDEPAPDEVRIRVIASLQKPLDSLFMQNLFHFRAA